MALHATKVLTRISITDMGKRYSGQRLSIRVNLKCWGGNATDLSGETPVINKMFDVPMKVVPGVTIGAILTAWAKDVKAQANEFIRKYNREQSIAENYGDNIDSALDGIEGTLSA